MISKIRVAQSKNTAVVSQIRVAQSKLPAIVELGEREHRPLMTPEGRLTHTCEEIPHLDGPAKVRLPSQRVEGPVK